MRKSCGPAAKLSLIIVKHEKGRQSGGLFRLLMARSDLVAERPFDFAF